MPCKRGPNSHYHTKDPLLVNTVWTLEIYFVNTYQGKCACVRGVVCVRVCVRACVRCGACACACVRVCVSVGPVLPYTLFDIHRTFQCSACNANYNSNTIFAYLTYTAHSVVVRGAYTPRVEFTQVQLNTTTTAIVQAAPDWARLVKSM